MTTNSDILKRHAEARGVPLRTLGDVRETLAAAKTQGSDETMARMMLRHGRLTDEARAYVAATYPQT